MSLLVRTLSVWLAVTAVIAVMAAARPDGGETHPLPGPGLTYGGIPYGSVSGDVAAYFRKRAPSGGRRHNYDVDFAPIEQWLR